MARQAGTALAGGVAVDAVAGAGDELAIQQSSDEGGRHQLVSPWGMAASACLVSDKEVR